MKKLYRSRDNKVWKGILGGVGEYTSVDATVLRLLFVLLVIFTGIFPGVIFYLIAILIVPEGPAKKASR
jgi:phage shock protein PspC (stress-responsive transcriptional regulator)